MRVRRSESGLIRLILLAFTLIALAVFLSTALNLIDSSQSVIDSILPALTPLVAFPR